jgi:hypothetical protein
VTDATTEIVVLDGSDGRVWSGSPRLADFLVPIDSVESHPRNPRRGNLDVIAGSLSSFGQRKPIVVQESTRWIVTGNHTRRAALEKLGWTHIAADVAPMSDDDALDYLLADNRSSDLGDYDDAGLIEILEQRQDVGALTRTGFTADDVDDLIASVGATRTTAEEEFRGGYSETDEEIAERQAVRLAGEPMREIVLMYSVEEYQAVARWIGMLQREWGTTGTIKTVYEALRRSAENL